MDADRPKKMGGRVMCRAVRSMENKLNPRKWKIITAVMFVALIGSNLWWLYNSIDAGITHTYREKVLEEQSMQLKQLLVIGNHYATGRQLSEVKALISKVYPEKDMFEKDGNLVAGWLVVKTTANGKVSSLALE